MPKPSLLTDLIDFQVQAQLDAKLDRKTVRQRDRQIGPKIPARKSDLATLRTWVSMIRQGRQGQGHQAQTELYTLIAGLWILGLTGGGFLSLTFLHYDGSAPINLVHALIGLVGSQLLLLLALLLLLTCGLGRVQEAFSFINPAFWLTRLAVRMKPVQTSPLSQLIDTSDAYESYGICRWLLIYLAQQFTVALNIGIIATLFYLIVATDLAFGWSTTLQVETDTMSDIFGVLSLPWRWALPIAAPDAGLVEASRFFRLQTGSPIAVDMVARLGTWWMFLLMCLCVYGLIPRMLLLLYAGVRYDRALAIAIRGHPRAPTILFSLRHRPIDGDDCGGEASPPADDPPLCRKQIGRPVSAVIVEWAEIKSNPRALSRAGIQITQVVAAGGRQSTEVGRERIREIMAHRPEAVVVVTASWEPPILDLMDFLKALRAHMEEAAFRIVFLVPMETADGVDPQDLAIWEASLHALGDPGLCLELPAP